MEFLLFQWPMANETYLRKVHDDVTFEIRQLIVVRFNSDLVSGSIFP